MTTVHQVLPSFSTRDAIGAHALQVQQLLRDEGHRSELLVEHPPEAALQDRVQPLDGWEPDGPTVLVYQASVGSGVASWLEQRPEPLVVNHHNVTPPEFFDRWEPAVAPGLRTGRYQLADLAARCELAIPVSDFNARALDALGYQRVETAPILLDLSGLDRTPDPATAARLARARVPGSAHWLFVGRIAPNKAQHNVVKALAMYRRIYDPQATLALVGGSAADRYLRALRAYVHELGLDDAVEIAGSVPPEVLTAHYRAADVFVCASEHEGFCVPLLEAMATGVPIVAFAAGAVPETVGEAAVLVGSSAPAVLAAAAHRVVTDVPFRERLVARGKVRLDDFELRRSRARYLEVLEPVLERAG
ncbi:MAG: glycosyltransferase [Actinomycetia bacterium]|nr:glycosyltransferase [Actinomycetes bacterium]